MRRTPRLLFSSSVSATVLSFFAAHLAVANPVTYTIDSASSSLTVGVAFNNLPLPGQTPGITDPSMAPGPLADDPASKTSALGGTLVADRTGGVLTFSGGSLIDPLLNVNAEFVPPEGVAIPPTMAGPIDDEIPVGAPDDIFTPGEDNFGYQLDLVAAGHAFASIRDLTLDITEGSASLGGPTTGLGLRTTGGFFNVMSFSVLAESSEQSAITDPGDPAILNMGGPLTSSVVGTTETIMLPILIQDGDFTISGLIVARGTVPEPTSIVLMLSMMGAVMMTHRRKRT